MAKKKYHCPICDGTNIQGKAWIDLNKNVIEEFFEVADESDFWCVDCENHIMPIKK